MLRKHGLIAIPIRVIRPPLDIGRQRRLAQPFQNLRNRRRRAETNYALAVFTVLQYFRREVVCKPDDVAAAEALAGFYQRAPFCLVPIQSTHQKNFGPAPRVFADAVQPRRKHAGIVQHQAIAVAQIARKMGKDIVVKCAFLARHNQHSGTASLLGGLLRDQLLREFIIEVRDLPQSIILGIESSCDETAAACVAEDGRILSSVVASQLSTHAKYGGVVPELASREHLRAIVPVVREALQKASVSLPDLAAIAVTEGPGLVGSLLVGVTYAKALCFSTGLPLIAVNHVEGHIYSVMLQHPEIRFPALALVVSGGHTHLFQVEAEAAYHLLGKTRDDAAGEAYDKVAKLLGFGYPGGPIIDKLAPYGNAGSVRFSPAKMKGNELDFSFSGLKTAVLRWTEQNDVAAEIANRRQLGAASFDELLRSTSQSTLDMLASFQKTVIDELLRRALIAADRINAQSILVSGGVACNSGLQKAAREHGAYQFFFPSLALATDNAAMIAAAAFPKWRRGDFAGMDLKASASLMLA